MLILILIDVQYSQKAVFSFEKGLDGQNHPSSCSNQLVKKCPPAKFLIPPLLNAIWKTLGLMLSKSDFISSSLISFPERGEYEFVFEFVNLLWQITHMWRCGTPQNFFLAFIDEFEKQIIIKKTVEMANKKKIILIFTMLHFLKRYKEKQL